jgi:agmatinase
LDIDAHNDLHGTSDNLDHGNVFLHIAQLPFIKAIIQLGSRGFRTINQIIEHPKVIQIPKEKFSTDVLEYWLKKFEGCANYLSVDLDSLDPQYFPYVDFGVPGGFSKIELLTIINMIFNSGAVIGADIVEGVGGGNITRGDYDIPLEILISILSNFFNIQKGGINNNG